MDTLVADVVGVADSLGFERYDLAGHDFGAMMLNRKMKTETEAMGESQPSVEIVEEVPHRETWRETHDS
ncbi:MAG: alpha/beta hydrolase [Dehalococcoidia bacterium]